MPSRPSVKIEVSPAACSVRSRSQQKSFLFLLEEKIGRAQIKKCKENFFAGCESASWRTSGGGAASLGVFLKIGSDFVQKVPQFYKIGVLGRGCLALASLGLGRNEDFEGIFEVEEKGALGQAEVRRAKLGQNEILQINLFSSAFGGKQSGNLITAQKQL